MVSVTLSELNRMDLESFVAHLGNLVEYFPVLAAAIYDKRPFTSNWELIGHVYRVIDKLPFEGTQCEV
jgi:2-oxo-4-hydroxy-4-carboxy--5-ureidoimidazoline (OHCU) decarboxylase